MPSDAICLFESLASATWDRIRFGEELDCSQQEETITDTNLLDIKRARLANVRVQKIGKKTESKTGLDWEWWMGSNRIGWWRYAVQAKKVNKSRQYGLRKKVGDRFQFDILDEYSRANDCVPVYCFYNFNPSHRNARYWNCNLPFDEPQLGCTLARMDVVKQAFKKDAPKTFRSLHFSKETLPWRCLVRCPLIVTTTRGQDHPLVSESFAHLTPHEKLPPFLTTDVETEDSNEFPPDLYSSDLGVYPERRMVVGVDSSVESGWVE